MRAGLLVPVALLAVFVYVMANKGWHGGGKWFLLSLALGVFMAFAVPRFPGSPISCMAHHNGNCASQSDALGWAFAVCFLPAIIGTWGKERT